MIDASSGLCDNRFSGKKTVSLLKNIANSVQVGSRYYRGVVTGRYGEGGAGRARIEFVFDREQVRKVYWHED
jgi:hypothetical protein